MRRVGRVLQINVPGASFHYLFFKNNHLWLKCNDGAQHQKERIKVKVILNLSSIPTVCVVYTADFHRLSHLVGAPFLGPIAQNVFPILVRWQPPPLHGTGGKGPLPPCFGPASWELGRDSCCKQYEATCLISAARPSLATKFWKTRACHVKVAATTLLSSADCPPSRFCFLLRLVAPTLNGSRALPGDTALPYLTSPYLPAIE